MLKKILLVLFILIAGFLVFTITRPATFSVQRSIMISAPPNKIFEQVNDFHNWMAWSPWEKLDPEMKRTFSGEDKGVGARYAWEGNKNAGAGNMEITKSEKPSRIIISLNLLEPMEIGNQIEFSFEKKDKETNVVWTMTGKNNFMGKLMGIFMNMDKMVGKDFETGLANLKNLGEK